MINVMELVPFIGVVEDRNDPTKAGRVRVRAIGFHSQDVTLIPTEDLPWATPIQPTTSAAVSGIGTTPSGLLEGTWVFGMFLDGRLAQIPVVLGSIGGIPQDRIQGNVNPVYLDEPDVNRIARGVDIQKTHPLIEMITNTVAKNIPTAGITKSTLLPGVDNQPGPTWDQPSPVAKSAYPFNHVTETESGHVIELDDTPGSERVRVIHRNGSMIDMQPSGDVVVKNIRNAYTLTVGDDNVYVAGNAAITVNGNVRLACTGDFIHNVQGDYHLYVGGNRITNVAGTDVSEIQTDRSISIGGNDNVAIGKAFAEQVGTDYSSVIGGVLNVTTGDEIAVTSSADLTITAKGNGALLASSGLSLGAGGAIDVAADGVLTVKSTGLLHLTSEANVTMDAATTIAATASGTVTVNGSTINLN